MPLKFAFLQAANSVNYLSIYRIVKDTDFDTAAHATRASSVNKLTSTSRRTYYYALLLCIVFQLMDDKITPSLRK